MKTKRVAMGMLALGMAMSLLGGCGASKKLNLKKESFVVEYGNTVSTKASDYLDKGTKKEVLKKAKFSLKVENEKDKEYPAVGKYQGTIAFEDEKVTFTVEVKDSVKPTLEDGFPKEVRVEANAVDVDLTKYFAASDLSDVTMTVKGDVDLSKMGEYEVKVIATDAYKNKAVKKAKIVVVSLEEAITNGVSAYVDGTKPQSEAMKQKIEEEKKAEQERQAQAQQSTAGVSETTNNHSDGNKGVFYTTYPKTNIESVINTANSFLGRTDMSCNDFVIQSFYLNGFCEPYASAYYVGISVGNNLDNVQVGDILITFTELGGHAMLVTGKQGNVISIAESGLGTPARTDTLTISDKNRTSCVSTLTFYPYSISDIRRVR